MAQLFHPSTNTISKASIFGAVFIVAAILALIYSLYRSPYQTQVSVVREQPVPFSHEHHVQGLGIDCRYCHTSVEESSFAGIPPTETCMTCHSQIWDEAEMLLLVRESFRTNTPLRWNRVHNLPDFVYFHHGIHVQKGIGCATCHGRVDQMPLTWKAEPMTMEWCLDCHRNPDPHLRHPDDIFAMDWRPRGDRSAEIEALVRYYGLDQTRREQLTDCSMCHR